MLKLPDTEKSYWQEIYSRSLYPSLQNNFETDVAVVGAGITGLTVAYLLKQSGFKVAVLEKNTIGSGTTGRTTGKVTSQHNLVYADMQKRMGIRTARLYGEANQSAVRLIDKIINLESINCDWKMQDNYVYTSDPSKVRQFRQEAEVASALGLPSTYEINTPLPFEVVAAVKFAGQGTLHSQKYLLALAAIINGSGSHVFENSNATGIQDGSPGRVKTKKATIIAKHIIVATNVPTLPLMARGGYCALEYPLESYIVASKFEDELTGMYISPDYEHYSILPININDNRLLLIGGNGHISGLRGNKKFRYKKLLDYAEKQFGITSVKYHWSDRDYLSYDSIPLVGKLYPWSKNLYVGTAFMKWGLTYGTVAAMILHDLICDDHNKWASTFDSNRIRPVLSIPRVISQYARHPFGTQ